MLVEVQKTNKVYTDLQALVLPKIHQKYAKTPAGKAAKQ
jgi:hypothetical protein